MIQRHAIAYSVAVKRLLLFFAVLCSLFGLGFADAEDARKSDMVAADTSGGITMDVEVSESNLVTVRITNKRKHAVIVDKELVFMLSVAPVNSEGVLIPRNHKSSLPQIDSKLIASRFIVLKPTESIVRKINLNSSFKVFVSGQSIPLGAPTSYEAFMAISEMKQVAELEVEYGNPRVLVGLNHYIGKSNIPAAFLTEQLRCMVKITRNAGI